MIPLEIARVLESRFSIHSARPLAGGDINRVFRVETSLGPFCLKINSSERFPGMFDEDSA